MIWASDLTDAQWQTIQEVLPPAKGGRTGRPRTYPLREIGNAVFYQARTGWAWRLLPHDFAPHGDGWNHFHRWRDGGLIERVQEGLRQKGRVQEGLRQKGRVQEGLRQKGRVQEGREPTPSAAIIDSQSVASR